MLRTCAALVTTTLTVAGCGEEAHLAPGFTPLCGDGVQVEGELCLAHELVPTPYAPRQMMRGDFDGDGRHEYYTSNGWSGGCIFLAERDGAFVELGRWDTPEEGLYHAVIHDFDRDGRDDAFVLLTEYYWYGHVGQDRTAAKLLLNRGWTAFEYDIGFTAAGESHPGAYKLYSDPEIALGDFDGDGVMDLFASRNPRDGDVLVYDPEPPYVYGTGQLYDFTALGIDDFKRFDRALPTVADLDEDGYDDLVLADHLGEVWVLRGDPELALTPVQLAGQPVLLPSTDLVLIEDVDGDGEQDLVGVAIDSEQDGPVNPSSFALARGEGGGRFTQVATLDARSEIVSSIGGMHLTQYPGAVLLDLDGSGYPALIYALKDEHRLVVHPHFGRRLGEGVVEFPLVGEPRGVFREPREDGGFDLLVPVNDDRGTPDEWEDDGRWIDRWRLDP